MTTIPAPTTALNREEWEDADFDIPDDLPLHTCDAESDKDGEEDEDWDMEMDFGKTGGAKLKAVVAGMAARSQSLGKAPPAMINIRPPLPQAHIEQEEDDDDDGVSTIKVTALPTSLAKSQPSPIDEDMESAFALPSDLTQLSLAPLSLNHRSSKHSLEWGDKDQTSSSQSSDTYSSLGFADVSPSSNSTTSASLPDTESDADEDDSELDGLIIPAVFESGQGGKQLNRMLELKKRVQIRDDDVKVSTPDPEDDFEIGLIINDEADLSASKLMQPRDFCRSKSVPARPPAPTRPPSRLKFDRAKSPTNPPTSSIRQFQQLKVSSSSRPQSYKDALISALPIPSGSFLSPKPGSLRGQKSHSGLKPPTPPSTQRKLVRKASLSSLLEISQAQASASGSPSGAGPSSTTKPAARYETPTAASRAKSHTNSTSRIHAMDYMVPPTRPSTPSTNPAALRLTMPTSIRMKSRPALSSVFPSPTAGPSTSRATSPLPPSLPSRPPSSLSLRSKSRQGFSAPQLPPSAPKVLRRPKRQRTYGDGTELDGIDDLPTDREKEGRFRVMPKGYGNRIPGGTYSSKTGAGNKGTIRKKGRKEGPEASADLPLASATNSLKHTGRIDFPSIKNINISVKKKKKDAPFPISNTTRRKPTLIRNLGGSSAPKVVGEMKWNPSSLRWEGNDQALRDFDVAIGTSTRPALITHLTGSSIGSPVGSFTSGVRKVGNMMFDPARMCWISTLAPEDEEPDVFADMADDEEDGDGWETKGGTIRASLQQNGASSDTSANSSTNAMEAHSPSRSHSRTISESGSERGSRASVVYDVDDSFLETCRAAEERHRLEMKGWKPKSTTTDPFAEPDRSNLYEIRALATRKY